MKKLALLSLLIFAALVGFSQSQRLVLLEHFTQASCGPCATYNPSIHTLLVNNPDKITSINYHTSWPGYDPMYNHNPTDAAARTSYYGVSSVPNSVLDGNAYNGHPNGWNISTVNALYAIPSPFELSVYQHLSAGNDTLFVTALVLATEDIQSPASAFLTVIEKYIHFNTAPGSNQEKDFYNVMKKILPTKTGIALPTPMLTGEYAIIESYWPLANVYNNDQLSVVGFIQNTVTKEVHQSANLTSGNFVALYDNDVELMTFNNLSDHMCKSNLSPELHVRNNGNTPLTSLELKYRINDGAFETYTWTGNLPLLATTNITLPEMSYELLEDNVLEIYAHQTNQGDDEYHKNDTIHFAFSSALQASREVMVKVRTDNSPEEITWEILDENSEVVASGGPYTEANQIVTTVVDLNADGCYEFYIYDAGDNGVCCGNGAGFFRVFSGSVNIALGTDFGAMATAQFDVVSVGVTQLPVLTEFEVYPNPASSQMFIEFTPERNRTVNVGIFNQLGQSVYSNEILSPSDVTQKLNINTSNWPAGIYMIRMDNGSGISSSKVSVTR